MQPLQRTVHQKMSVTVSHRFSYILQKPRLPNDPDRFCAHTSADYRKGMLYRFHIHQRLIWILHAHLVLLLLLLRRLYQSRQKVHVRLLHQFRLQHFRCKYVNLYHIHQRLLLLLALHLLRFPELDVPEFPYILALKKFLQLLSFSSPI